MTKGRRDPASFFCAFFIVNKMFIKQGVKPIAIFRYRCILILAERRKRKERKTMKKFYGNLTNRLEEGRTVPEIKEGMDLTMYYWSDRTCYYVTEVIDQKHIKVMRYYVVADRSKAGGMGHQDWLYFKTTKEASDYLKANGLHGYADNIKDIEEEWVYRYNKWMRLSRQTEENYCTDRERKALEKNGYFDRYFDIGGKVSFGVRDYYYDWEF